MKLNWEKPQGQDLKTYETVVNGVTTFGRTAAPLAFTWLGWSALLALVRYVELKTGLWALTALNWLLGILLWGYFITFTSAEDKVEWKSRGEMLSRPTWIRTIVSIAATAGMVAASYWFADVFMKNPL